MTVFIRHPRECGDPSPVCLQRENSAARGLARFEAAVSFSHFGQRKSLGNRDLDLALAVTADQVQTAAKLFAKENRIVLWYVPEEKS